MTLNLIVKSLIINKISYWHSLWQGGSKLKVMEDIKIHGPPFPPNALLFNIRYEQSLLNLENWTFQTS
jgi:hypothetical protein